MIFMRDSHTVPTCTFIVTMCRQPATKAVLISEAKKMVNGKFDSIAPEMMGKFAVMLSKKGITQSQPI